MKRSWLLAMVSVMLPSVGLAENLDAELAREAQVVAAVDAVVVAPEKWRVADAMGDDHGRVFFLMPGDGVHLSTQTTPVLLVRIPGVSDAPYAIPVTASGYTNVDGAGSPIGNAFAYTKEDCSDTPIVDTRVIPRLPATGALSRVKTGVVMKKDGRTSGREIWTPVGEPVSSPLVAQRFETDGPCLAWAPIVGPEDRPYLRRARFATELPGLANPPLRFVLDTPPAAMEATPPAP